MKDSHVLLNFNIFSWLVEKGHKSLDRTVELNMQVTPSSLRIHIPKLCLYPALRT